MVRVSMPFAGELVWYRESARIRLAVSGTPKVLSRVGAEGAPVEVTVSNLSVPWHPADRLTGIVYRHPILLAEDGNNLVAGPVFAVLTGSRGDSFQGNRIDFRDLLRTAARRSEFMYVLPADEVEGTSMWQGFVRTGRRRWIELPCPRPQAVYNRLPTRFVERTISGITAKERLRSLDIPLFNPDYFNKAVIYDVIQEAGLDKYLPETSTSLTRRHLQTLLSRHRAVYLKPAGGSIGHGIIRVLRDGPNYLVEVLKNGDCQAYGAASGGELWSVVCRHRLPGAYVLQAAKRSLEWDGRPCDFRLLLQKRRGGWRVVGKGVRVAGPTAITTHVPNGGYIVEADQVLKAYFPDDMERVNNDLDDMAVACAHAIDRHYRGQLGEMSMDIGLDAQGHPWFFEANSKPMKFDEPDIRRRSLQGVLAHLEELRSQQPIR